MKYLRLYKEHNEIPDYFIDLDSIGYVLDPNTGMMYAKWKKGGYDKKKLWKAQIVCLYLQVWNKHLHRYCHNWGFLLSL